MRHYFELPFILSRIGRHSIVVACLLFAAPAYAAFPTATAVNITGTTEVGFQLTGNYVYGDADGDVRGFSTFRWPRNGASIEILAIIDSPH